jgi:hypothetical protein
MNGVDYTKHLNREREYVKDTVSKTQKEAERRVADANERNEASEAKLRQKHLEDRAELESKYQKSLDNLKQKQADTLEGNGNNFQEDLDKQRAEFQAKKETQSKDFDQRLNDIKSSYKKSFDSERDLHHHVQGMDKEKYQKNIADLQGKHHSEISKYGDRMKEAGSGIKDTYNRERQQLVRAQEDQVSDVYKSERKKQNDLSNRIRREIETTKEAHEAEKIHGRDYMEQKLSKMEKMHQDRNMALAHEYSQKNSELAEKEKNQSLETNRQHQHQLAEVTRDYNKSLRHIENEKRRRSVGGDELAEVREKQQGLSGQALQRNQIRQLNGQMAKDKVETQKVINDMNDTFREDMKARGADYSAGLQKKENQANAEKLLEITHEREKAQTKTGILEKQNLTNKEDFERGLNFERNASNDKINNLKLHFNKSMSALEDKMRLSADEMKRANKDDKDAFIKQTNERQIKDLLDMKRDVAKSMDKTIESYEGRIAAYQRENENLRRTMDQKISDVVEYADKKLDSQKRLYEERRQAELNDQKIAMDQREHHIKQDTNSILVNFQKKLDKMQVENESRIKLLTNDYENKLRELAERNSKEKALDDAAHKLEVDNLKQTYATDKANLIATFESNIEGIKAGHEEQMNQMKNFKKLS